MPFLLRNVTMTTFASKPFSRISGCGFEVHTLPPVENPIYERKAIENVPRGIADVFVTESQQVPKGDPKLLIFLWPTVMPSFLSNLLLKCL